MRLTTTICTSLDAVDDAELDHVTADADVFLDRRWLRMLDALDLTTLVRGELSLRYVLVRDGTRLIAVCPFLVTRSRSIYYHYSLEKFFFVSWQDELVRMNPESARWSRWVVQAVNAYRAFARASRSGIDGWVLAASPLSYRGGIATAPLDPAAVQEAHRAVLDALKDEARKERLPLCFYGVDAGRAELRRSLRGSGFEEVFLVYDNRLDTDFKTFDDYLARFQSKERKAFRRDMRQVGEAGIQFTVTSNWGSLGGDFERLYETTYSKYGEEHFRHPESFWAQLERHLGPRTEAIVARNGSTVVGFTSLLHKGDDLWVYRIGRTEEQGLDDAPLYFSLVFYEPIKRAVALGAKRIWLSGGTWKTKRRRGAVGQPLYSYMWFPSSWSRALLMPYLSLFSKISHAEMTKVVAPPRPPEAGSPEAPGDP
ncbi:peptidogalycan biosysnthesis protein [Sorangium sp. So ce1000]|uniref:peptidogalycan biosysnthesis protein n=1 Tax=Sorangium sp. So ce1000 TaxID=3133325 RepID=UPI003F62F419